MEEAKTIGILVRHGENNYELLVPEAMPDFVFEGSGTSIRGTMKQIAELTEALMEDVD